MTDEQRKKNLRTALILATVVAVFFIGFIARMVLLGR
ncbi:cytochrome oxidase small assembly protein [Ramlibacter albus]|nr:cytochrome oxidase small assembly protein [Ramlibacter albus]